jgi:hypothetical protein
MQIQHVILLASDLQYQNLYTGASEDDNILPEGVPYPEIGQLS